MRWIWIDTFIDFEPGRRASAIKNVTLAEECLRDHFPGYAVFPPSLMIEGMAQTAGILAGEARGFSENVILAKIRKARFDDYARPGDRLRYDAVLESIDDRGAVAGGRVYLNDREIGQIDLMFSHVAAGGAYPDIPESGFVFTEQFMSLLAGFRGSRAGKERER